MLMEQIDARGLGATLVGAAIGNGCTGTATGVCGGDRPPFLAEVNEREREREGERWCVRVRISAR